jgi:hypothetical protein
MLIHVATDNDIYPPRFGATQRTFGLCRGLARRHDVKALCVVPNRSTGAASEVVGGVSLIRRRAWYTSVAWRLDRLGLAPLLVSARGHRGAAASLVRGLPGDAALFAADLLLTPLFDRHPAPLKVYTAHNVELDHFQGTHPSLGGSHRWVRELERLERAAVERAALTVACTADDAARLRELYGVSADRVMVAPNGWDETRVKPASAESRAAARATLGLGERQTVALFVGSDVPHNREAAEWLLSRVAPALAPDGFVLLIVGSVARALHRPAVPGVRLADEVDDLTPFLHAADVGLNPVRAGGGSNVKLPTYLAAGLAVISTPFGLRGYPQLAPFVTVAALERTAEALRERPQGWPARSPALPDAVAELAWGTIGERLGEGFERAQAPAHAAWKEARG